MRYAPGDIVRVKKAWSRSIPVGTTIRVVSLSGPYYNACYELPEYSNVPTLIDLSSTEYFERADGPW